MEELDDIALLRKRALESRSRKVGRKDYDYEEQLQLHPHEELEMSYNAAKKRAAKKRATKRKSVKETSKKLEEQQPEEKPSKAKKEDPMVHFVNPHGGFMPYSTLSLAVKRTPDIGHVSPISSESPSPVNLYAKEEPPAIAVAQPVVKTIIQPPEPKQALPAVKRTAVTKQTVEKPVAKPVVANQSKETKPEQIPKKVPITKKPLNKQQRRDSRSCSSSSDSSSSFSSSSGSSFSSNSSASRHRKRKRRSSSSSSSSRSSSSLSSSSSSSSSSDSRHSSTGSRKRERRSKRRSSERQRSSHRRSVERNRDSYHSRNKISRVDDGNDHWQNSRGQRFNSQRGRERDFHNQGNFQRNRTYSDGGGRFYRNQPQEFQRDTRFQRPFNRPAFGRGRQGFNRDRQNFNSPQFRSTNFRGRGRDFRNQQHQRPFGLRNRLDSRPNYRSNERFVRRREDGSRSPEHERQHRRDSVERHQSSRSERNSSHTRYDSKIGAPIKESKDHAERRPRAYSESNHSKYSDRSSERQSRSPSKSPDRMQSDEDSEAELELQPESDPELAPLRREVNSHVHHPDSDHSSSNVSKKRRRVASSSSSSSSSGSSSSNSSSEGSPERSRRINSPIRVSPERRDYKEKQGAAIHRKDRNDDSTYHHPRSQGHKRLHSDPDSSLDSVSKRLRPDLALRLGPDPEIAGRGSQHDDFIPSRQRRFLNNNNAANASQTKGNALEIARQFRMQKQKTSTVSKVATVSKVVKSIATDNLSNAQLDEKVKETDPEKEKELSDRIKKIQEQNEKIRQRQKEIEDDIEQYA